jgi:hypothetical protein
MSKQCFALVMGIFLMGLQAVQAQEFRAVVEVAAPGLQVSDASVVNRLKNAIQEMMNTTKWTEDEYLDNERIDLNIFLTITSETSAFNFNAELNIKATRPVYGSDYNTTIFAHNDNQVGFFYDDTQPIQYFENNYVNNLAQVLAFYAYIVLGYDYDSFSELGGERFFNIAQTVLSTVPQNVTGQYKGWVSTDGNKARFYILDNAIDPRAKPFRVGMYEYHRLGLDFMHADPVGARANIEAAMEKIAQTNREIQNSMIVQVFNNSKTVELREIFLPAERESRSKIYQIMTKLNPAGLSQYRQLNTI